MAIKAAIFDLDGVITNTAKLHSRAWEETFKQYNALREKRGEMTFQAYDARVDYPRYIDGMPRISGIENFLKSRNITLSKGNDRDDLSAETVQGLANFKNRIYKRLIESEGVTVLDKNVNVLKDWREKGVKTALISSSKNCKTILDKTGLKDLFEVVIDGEVTDNEQISGKPSPDIFLRAAKDLGVSPEESLIVEDSPAGIAAGRDGNFRLVIGIINMSHKAELLKAGANLAVENLMELKLVFKKPRKIMTLPSALKNVTEIVRIFKKKQPLLFLDFDGTLSPIVEHHKDARISQEMRELVYELSKRFPVAVVSGRGLADVREKVALPDLFYAGSHGYEISGPYGFSKDHEEAIAIVPVFEELEPTLEKRLNAIEGVDFERKKFTLAVHYRQVSQDHESQVHEAVNEILKKYPLVQPAEGKKVIEIRPAIDWHKGKAVEFLKHHLSDEKDPLSIYIGDDVTDEDAFRYVANGIGILVGDHGKETYADYHLENIEQVEELFKLILEL